MTKEECNISIATGERQLPGFWAKATHYGVVLFCLFFPAIFLCNYLFNYLKGTQLPFDASELCIFVVLPFVFGVLLFMLQKRRLKFKHITTTLTRAQIEAIIHRVGDELEWKGHYVSSNAYKAKTYPGFFSGSWGEAITILLAGNSVFVNSICDPDKRGSLASFGRNRENENTLIESIKRAEQLVASGMH